MTAPETFNGLPDATQEFLAELARNNRRSWFEPNRARYLAEIRRPAERLTGIVADRLTQRTRRPHGGNVRCLHRDTDPAADKAPYDTRLHLRWTTQDDDAPAAGWSCTVAPAAVTVSVGFRARTPEELQRYRALVGASGDLLGELLDWVGGSVSGDGAALHPQAHPQAHPQIDLTTGRGFTVTRTLADDWRRRHNGFLGALDQEIRALMPIHRFLADQL